MFLVRRLDHTQVEHGATDDLNDSTGEEGNTSPMPVKRLQARKPVIAAIIATGTIASTGLAVQQTAMAGTNGQHITFCTNYDAQSVEARGRNQDGAVEILMFDLRANRGQNGCAPYDPNVWWKGLVHLTWHTDYDMPMETDCFVPEVNDTDFVMCADDPGFLPLDDFP
jgi:hypothetical protein